jgi:hypothetical protein
LTYPGSDAVAPDQDVACFERAIGESGHDRRGVGSIDFGQRSAELHLDASLARSSGQHPMKIATPDHLQSRAELRLVMLSIDGADEVPARIEELESVARHADFLNALAYPQFREHIHAVRGDTEKQSLVDRLARSTLAQDGLDAHTPQEHAQRGTRNPAPDDHDPPDASLRHTSSNLLSWGKRSEGRYITTSE